MAIRAFFASAFPAFVAAALVRVVRRDAARAFGSVLDFRCCATFLVVLVFLEAADCFRVDDRAMRPPASTSVVRRVNSAG